ncbi:MAG TPA: FxsA family protein [Alphaproteobacteria bacterium]|jgi:UPF0716 protein FxsA|nr:FxsA family protein [Alphaproteobacteria bacterium]
MYIFFLPILLLPLFEIIGFVVIGGEIGVGMTLLWLLCSTFLGLWLLQGRGAETMAHVKQPQEAENPFFAIREVFDTLCLFLAGILFVFPGFISDFIAVPLLIAPLRHFFWRRMRDNPNGFIRRTFTMQGTERTRHGGYAETTIIEGEFTTMNEDASTPPAQDVNDRNNTLPPQ